MSWTDCAPGIRVRQSTAYRMNSTLLLHADSTVLIDPGVLPDEMDDIAAVAHAARPHDTILVFTHAHWDHVLGRIWWPASGCIAHAAFGAETVRFEHHIDRSTRAHMQQAGVEWDHLFEHFTPDLAVSGERPLQTGPWALVFRDAFGHCDSQLSVHLPEQRLLVAADMLSDIEIPILNRSFEAYRDTLEGLLPLVDRGEVETLVPGHGAIAAGRDAVRRRLEDDLAYVTALGAAVTPMRAEGRTLAEIEAHLAPRLHAHPGGAHEMDETHRRNIRLTYEAAGATP
jgi:hydroxyacylglutathione hydrolase